MLAYHDCIFASAVTGIQLKAYFTPGNSVARWRGVNKLSATVVSEEKMTLEDALRKSIIIECNKLIARYHRYHNSLHLAYLRNKKRIIDPPPKEIHMPSYWKKSKLFNPFYVRGRAASIAKSINKKILNGQYAPHNPHNESLPKPCGGSRVISVYEIPDAAVSNYLYHSLMAKNKHRFSSFSYAYRQDRNVHFAIQDIVVSLQDVDRLFISEYDFSDFFGSISHKYLFGQFKANGFLISDLETRTIQQFLATRKVGIPQGTSLSLFLANLSCWRLDRALEDHGLRFARYADDTVIWSKSYNKICESYEIIRNFSKETEININAKKSEGISLLVKDVSLSEFGKGKTDFTFLGYKIAVDKISISDAGIRKIKDHISYLLYRHLLQPINGLKLKSVKVPANNRDRDLVVAIQQIRRYLYGNLTEQQLQDYIAGKISSLQFKGLMSFYPLVNNEDQLKELDGWLVHTVYHALKKRCAFFYRHRIRRLNRRFPFNVPKENLVEEFSFDQLYDLPSFMLIHKAIQKGITNYGLDFASRYNY